MLACHCPDPTRTAPGIWELLSNAIEHGNLCISFDEKSKLLRDGTFQDEVERRLKLDPYRSRRVQVEFERRPTLIRIVITDGRDGFDVVQALKREFSLDLPNGRGISIASQFCFDTMHYRGKGNTVEATVYVAPIDA